MSPHIDLDMYGGILKRTDTDISHVRSVANSIHSGTITVLTIAKLKELIMDPNAPSLTLFLSKTASELKRDHQHHYRAQTEDERLDELMEMARTNSFPTERPMTPWRTEKLSEEVEQIISNHVDDPLDPDDPLEDEVEQEEDPQEEELLPLDGFAVPMAKPNQFLWLPRLFVFNSHRHTWINTIFHRINSAHWYGKHNLRDRFLQHKIALYIKAHIPLVQYLDSLSATDDESIDVDHLLSLWGSGIGPTYLDCDRHLIKVTVREHVLKDSPLEALTKEYPHMRWTVDPTARGEQTPYLTHEGWAPLGANVPIETHRIYYEVIRIMNQCMSVSSSASWLYFASFVDLFDYCLSLKPIRMDDRFLLTPIDSYQSRDGHTMVISDKLSPWQKYVLSSDSVYHAGDLPDLYHVLVNIPLHGEQRTPSYVLGKIYQKSLPFACQRRHLVKLVIECMQSDPTFAHLVRRLMWCLLTDMYPNGGSGGSVLGLRALLHIKQLTDSTENLIRAFSTSTSPMIVLVMFRLHIIYMADEQYEEQARQCIDWDGFKREVSKMAKVIRASHLFSMEDPFQLAHVQLSSIIKAPHGHVHRLRKRSVGHLMAKAFNEKLEKTILKDKQNFLKDRTVLLESLSNNVLLDTHIGRYLLLCDPTLENSPSTHRSIVQLIDRALSFYDQLLVLNCKSAILNALLTIDPCDRLTTRSFCLLLNPEYGGVSQLCIQMLCELVNVYYSKKASPKEINQRIGRISLPDFMVACFYLNMVALLDKISFEPLPAEVVAQTDDAMRTVRHYYFPGQIISDNIYHVSIALCCEKLCTLTGQGKHGDKKVAYDMEKQAYVCGNGKNIKQKKHQHDCESREGFTAEGTDPLEDDPLRADPSGDDPEDEDDDDDDPNSALRQMANILAAEDEQLDIVDTNNLTGIVATHKGKGAVRTRAMEDRRTVRNERKAFSKLPCSQPVLTFSLRGRALVWNGQNKYMFCPACGALHMYTVLNFCQSETGNYECNECRRQQLMHVVHRTCAYCNRSGPSPSQINEETKLRVLSPVVDPNDKQFDPLQTPENTYQELYFCKTHFRIARRYNNQCTKPELWRIIRRVQEARMLQNAKGIYKTNYNK